MAEYEKVTQLPELQPIGIVEKLGLKLPLYDIDPAKGIMEDQLAAGGYVWANSGHLEILKSAIEAGGNSTLKAFELSLRALHGIRPEIELTLGDLETELPPGVSYQQIVPACVVRWKMLEAGQEIDREEVYMRLHIGDIIRIMEDNQQESSQLLEMVNEVIRDSDGEFVANLQNLESQAREELAKQDAKPETERDYAVFNQLQREYDVEMYTFNLIASLDEEHLQVIDREAFRNVIRQNFEVIAEYTNALNATEGDGNSIEQLSLQYEEFKFKLVDELFAREVIIKTEGSSSIEQYLTLADLALYKRKVIASVLQGLKEEIRQFNIVHAQQMFDFFLSRPAGIERVKIVRNRIAGNITLTKAARRLAQGLVPSAEVYGDTGLLTLIDLLNEEWDKNFHVVDLEGNYILDKLGHKQPIDWVKNIDDRITAAEQKLKSDGSL